MSIVEEVETENAAIPPKTTAAGEVKRAADEQKGHVRWASDGSRPLGGISLAALACGSTIIVEGTAAVLRSSTGDGACWEKVPACDPESLSLPSKLPHFLHPMYRCEVLLLILALGTLVHWMCLLTLLQEERWKGRYLPIAAYVVLGSLIPAAYVVGDSTTLFLQIFPAVSDVCMVGCFCMDFILGRW